MNKTLLFFLGLLLTFSCVGQVKIERVGVDLRELTGTTNRLVEYVVQLRLVGSLNESIGEDVWWELRLEVAYPDADGGMRFYWVDERIALHARQEICYVPFYLPVRTWMDRAGWQPVAIVATVKRSGEKDEAIWFSEALAGKGRLERFIQLRESQSLKLEGWIKSLHDTALYHPDHPHWRLLPVYLMRRQH